MKTEEQLQKENKLLVKKLAILLHEFETGKIKINK